MHHEPGVFIRGKHLSYEMQNANNRLFSCQGVAVGHAVLEADPEIWRAKAHVGSGPVHAKAQWMKVTKCPTGLPLIHSTHSFLNAVIRPQC